MLLCEGQNTVKLFLGEFVGRRESGEGRGKERENWEMVYDSWVWGPYKKTW